LKREEKEEKERKVYIKKENRLEPVEEPSYYEEIIQEDPEEYLKKLKYTNELRRQEKIKELEDNKNKKSSFKGFTKKDIEKIDHSIDYTGGTPSWREELIEEKEEEEFEAEFQKQFSKEE